MTGPESEAGKNWRGFQAIRSPVSPRASMCDTAPASNLDSPTRRACMICTRRTARLRRGGLDLGSHSDEMRVQYEGLIGLARPSTLSLRARLLPGSFPLTFVLTARTDLEENEPEP